jgi:two-component system phosphate regulon sensor histidine kinase PhoR
LCDNAIKYNCDGGAVHIFMKNLEAEKEAVLWEVRDTGIGIPKEEQDRIFERFYRVDKSHSRETGGTGLGLSIVKHGAIIHDAQIEVESELGEGTVIRIIIPTRKNEGV